jgi:hypothetical protein
MPFTWRYRCQASGSLPQWRYITLPAISANVLLRGSRRQAAGALTSLRLWKPPVLMTETLVGLPRLVAAARNAVVSESGWLAAETAR